MNPQEVYTFHQTPADLAKDLILSLPLSETDRLYEPFMGEGAFYNNFPSQNPKDWSEIEQGRDYKDYQGEFDWVITNPPFRLETGTKRVNSFFYLLDYYSKKAKKGIAFLGNDRCFCTLTPKRLKALNDAGWYLTKITVCSVKKWRGRYFFIVFQKTPVAFYNQLLKNY
jgi:hypothetical protein